LTAPGSKQALLFEKRSKNFGASGRYDGGSANALLVRVFWFFFSKKKCFLSVA
jgi:hypothetical protein